MLSPALPESTALHALTAGAMATTILAMMTRTTRGHTGQPLAATPATTAIYLLITVAAAARLASGLADDAGITLLYGSAAAWVAAFALFLLAYSPMLLGPRPGRRVQPTCCSAPKFDPTGSRQINKLACRSASNLRADQHSRPAAA